MNILIRYKHVPYKVDIVQKQEYLLIECIQRVHSFQTLQNVKEV